MSYQHRDKLEGGLHHLTQSIVHIREAAGYMTPSEFASMWFSLLLTAKRMAAMAVEYRRWLEEHVFDGNLLDIEQHISQLRNSENILRLYLEKNIEAQKTSYTKEEREDQLVRENALGKFGQIEYRLRPDETGMSMQNPTDTTKVREFLLENLSKAITSMYDCLGVIIRSLDEILDNRRELFGQIGRLAAYIKEVEEEYLQSKRWEEDKESFIMEMRGRLGYDEDEEPYKPMTSYQYHERYVLKDMDSITRQEQKGGERARLECMKEGRDTIDEELLHDHLRNRNCLYLLHTRIASFEWKKVPSGSYAKLFTYMAAMDIAKAVATYIARQQALRKYHYAIMKLAFDDFGLTLPPEQKNAGEWLDFVNKHVRQPRGEKEIADNGSITKVTSNMRGTAFKTLAPDHLLGTTLEAEDFEKYEGLYGYCVQVINKVMRHDLKEQGFHPYWMQDKFSIPDYIELADMEKLQMQASVLKGDCLRF